MYLKRITITGFKSFASRTVLDLEPGITAVVGPNGSGKSNVADAIRWALGEQNKSRLRTRDREEVVFAGTDRRARASYAEVVLLFNNDDGVFPLELTEVEISRRLYRSGESDYRLAGRSVRLGDIQQLLAEAGFGANTYAVIGQGMIDGFLMSSPAERKLLFGEAAGIRGAELKREASLRKLTATEANITRLRDIQAELELRLGSLERTANVAKEQQQLELRLEKLRQQLIDTAQTNLSVRNAHLESELGELERSLGQWRAERETLETAQTQRLQELRQEEARQAARQAKSQELEQRYASRLEAASRQRAALERLTADLDRLTALRKREQSITAELAASEARTAELSEELGGNVAAADRAAKSLERADQVVAKVQASLVEIRQTAAEGTQQQYVSHALSIIKAVAQGLDNPATSQAQLRLLVHKAGRLLSHASKTGEAELLARIKQTQVRLEAAMTRRDTATEHQTNITITRRSLEIDMAHQQAQTTAVRQRLAELESEIEQLEAQRHEHASAQRDLNQAERELLKLKQDLEASRQGDRETSPAGGAAKLTEAAAMIERLRSQQGAAELRLAAIRQEREAVGVEQARYQALAEGWKLTAVIGKPSAADTASLERSITQLEAELATRHDLQRGAEVEYLEVQGRSGEMATQLADLEQAKTDLTHMVSELDQLIRERFKQNFAALAEHFSAYFTQLFNGGAASLELEEQDDGEYGILIKATPKGKRLEQLTTLSGGERAMAGVALLAAILRVNPSPFVVLDEVDAALDEANSARLATILEELANQSQLIVITHNRQTMKAARVLFGITMNEHHISHLLSLRLEEASALAAR